MDKSQLSLMHPWDCDMYSEQQLDYHHGNIAQLSGQLDASQDVISLGFSPFARGGVNITLDYEECPQPASPRSLSFTSVGTLEQNLLPRDHMTVNFLGGKLSTEDSNAMDCQTAI